MRPGDQHLQWEPVSKHCQPHVGGVAGEDAVVTTRDLYAVVDGITMPGAHTYDYDRRQISAGRFAALICAQTLAHLDVGMGVTEAVHTISSALDRAITAQQPGVSPAERPGAAVMVFDAVHSRLWWVGDTRAAWQVGDEVVRLYPQSRLDRIVGQARTLLWTGTDPQIWLETEAADPAAALLAGADRARAHLANSDSELGYGLVNGTAVPTTFVGEYSLDDASDVVIATNGYPELAPHDQLSWPHAESYLADLLAEDHNCVGALRGRRGACMDWHSFDDRSWLHLRRS